MRIKLLVIIGSLLSGWLKSADNLVFRCTTTRGVLLHEVEVGERCRLEVVYSGVSAHNAWPSIAGLNAAHVLGKSTRMSSTFIQGVKCDEVIYALDVQFSRPGVYTLGPATLPLSSGITLASMPCAIEVVAPRLTNKSSQDQGISARWGVPERKYIYRDEVVPCSLYFITRDENIQLQSLSPWMCDWAALKLSQQPHVHRVKQQESLSYEYRWEGSFVPHHVGKQWLPSMTFFYEKSAPTSWFPWAMLHHNAPQTASAQAVEITVKDLPSSKEHVAGVGAVNAVVWNNSLSNLKAGEAVTIVRIITGSFAPDRLHIPLPQTSENVRLYVSRAEVTGVYPHIQHSTEYIVQGIEEGNGYIMAQPLYFFDPGQERYVEHCSARIDINVTSGAKAVVTPVIHHEETLDTLPHDANEEGVGNTPLTMVSRWTIFKHMIAGTCLALIRYQIPLYYFIILLVLPLVWILMKDSIYRRYNRACHWYNKRKRIMKVMRELRAAEYALDCMRLHTLFVHYLAETIHLDPGQLTNDYVRSWLLRQGAAEDTVLAWYRFYQRLEYNAFAQSLSSEVHEIAQEASLWIQRITDFMRSDV